MKNNPTDPTNIKLVVSREFDAPRELVWAALARPDGKICRGETTRVSRLIQNDCCNEARGNNSR